MGRHRVQGSPPHTDMTQHYPLEAGPECPLLWPSSRSEKPPHPALGRCSFLTSRAPQPGPPNREAEMPLEISPGAPKGSQLLTPVSAPGRQSAPFWQRIKRVSFGVGQTKPNFSLPLLCVALSMSLNLSQAQPQRKAVRFGDDTLGT